MSAKAWIAGKVASTVAAPGVSQALTVLQFIVRVLGGWRATLWFCGLLWFAWQSHVNGALADKLQREKDAAVQQSELDKAKLDAARAQVNERVVTKYVDRIVTVKGRTQTIIKEVPIYVPADAPALPPGFRVLHDAAAQGELPDPARIADAAPVPAQDAAEAIAGNYGTCHETEARLTALQEWVREQQKIHR